jgi:hypothetical protein
MPIGFPLTPTIGQQWPVVSPIWEYAGGNVWNAIAGTGAAGATPITDRLASIVGTDDFIGLRASVPYLVSASAIATYTGGSPSATAPAAFTAGQWTAAATATAGQISFDLTTLPADGDSAITALEYRVGTGAAIAFTGTGTGVRVVTAGLTAGAATDLQVRAVNTVGAGAWSDVKNRTPLAGGGGGVATWQTVSATSESSTLNPSAPAGLISTDLQVAIIYGTTTADAYTPPSGWTLAGSIHTAFAGGTGIDVLTAGGSTAQGTWTFAGSRLMEIHRVSGASGVRAIEMREANTFVRAAGGFWLDWPNMPSPEATAVAGDCVLAVYYGPQNTLAAGTPPTDYASATARTTPNTQAAMYRSNAPAGNTGVLSHGVVGGTYEERASVTIVLAAT